MTLMTTGSTPSAAGYSEKSDATGPVAGVSPIMKMRAKVKDKKKLVMPGNKMKEDIDRINPHGPNRLFQYKVNIPEVGETIVYANSPAELRQKLRLIINPRFREGIDIERIFPGQAAQFFMQKRMQFMRNESVENDKENQQMAAGKIAIEKKKVLLKKQALQKQLQLKTQKLKKQVRAGAEQDETR